MPQLVSVTSVSIHLFKTLNALSCSENDLSLSFVNGFEGLDRTQHLLLAQLWVEASSGRASLSRSAAQAANLFQPSPLAGGDSDARFITPWLYHHPLHALLQPPCAARAVPRLVLLSLGSGGWGLRVPPPAVVSPSHRAASRCPSPLPARLYRPWRNRVWKDRQSQPAEGGIITVTL